MSYQRDSSRGVLVFAVILSVADVSGVVDVPTAAVTGGLVGVLMLLASLALMASLLY